MSSPHDRPLWQVLVPVRGGPVGKSRLTSVEGRHLTGPERSDLALAMAYDTVSAAVAGGRGPVAVLTGDDVVAELAAGCGATMIVDQGRGLNAELADAAASLGTSVAVCVLLGDLPALRPQDLGEALDLAQSLPAPGIVVPDWEGTGTTLVAGHRGAPGGAKDPPPFCFGRGSAQRHQRAGLRLSGLHLARLRADVDTPNAWEVAVRLGLGPATSALRRRLLEGIREGEPDDRAAAPLG